MSTLARSLTVPQLPGCCKGRLFSSAKVPHKMSGYPPQGYPGGPQGGPPQGYQQGYPQGPPPGQYPQQGAYPGQAGQKPHSERGCLEACLACACCMCLCDLCCNMV